MREISLHILDIAENSVAAGATVITIFVWENEVDNYLAVEIIDNGKGMDAETVASVVDPFVTSRTTRKVGLGIPFLKAAAEACQGNLSIQSEPGRGTKVSVTFTYNHIDRMPLGDLSETFLSLLVCSPTITWSFAYRASFYSASNQQVNETNFYFDNKLLIEELEGISFTEPEVINYLRGEICENLERALAMPTEMLKVEKTNDYH
jgi:hypothetical protein